MSSPVALDDNDRFDELVAGFVLGDLSYEELAIVESFDKSKFSTEVEKTDLAASRIFLTLDNGPQEELPDRLRELILAQSIPSSTSTQYPLRVQNSVVNPAPSVGLRELASWFVAIAASVLVLATWLPTWNGNVSVATLEQRREQLISSAPDVLRLTWQKPTDTETDSSLGDIVWSSQAQEGYMRFRGLGVNNPTVEQYQLWIFDPDRDEKPIDGGVFNVDKEGDVLVPIRAKLPVGKPTLFAITVEKPGGVVVSDRSRLPLLAKVFAN
jgi:anti-sigma-K factor RskA